MTVYLSKKDCLIILGALANDMHGLKKLILYGGDLAFKSEIIYEYVNNVHSKIYNLLISAADVEASSQDVAADIPKCTASDLDPREAGDEVSLDQHIQLYKEVF